MKVERVELFLLRLPLKRPYETSGFREVDRVPVILRVEGDGAVGWGESVATEFPWYSAETSQTCWYALTEFLIPRVLGREFAHPEQVAYAFEGIRGHRMAKATLEMACWDLAAKHRGVPLSSLLGGTRDRIVSRAAIGIQPTIETLLETIARELAAGYRQVKLKIKPGLEEEIASHVRAAYPDLEFMLDANSAYTIADLPIFKRLDAYRPVMIEQPLEPGDLVDHATLQSEISTPVCLDESIESSDDARRAIQIGACRIVNIKPGRVGGHREAKRIHDVCAAHRVPVWCGGMLEAGVGRAHNVQLASLPNFALPGDVSASDRYFAPELELIAEPFRLEADGTILVPQRPGIGVTVLEARIRALAVRTAAHG